MSLSLRFKLARKIILLSNEPIVKFQLSRVKLSFFPFLSLISVKRSRRAVPAWRMAVQLEQECGGRQKGACTCGRSRGSKGKAVKAVAVSPIYVYRRQTWPLSFKRPFYDRAPRCRYTIRVAYLTTRVAHEKAGHRR